jgi:hypothetical protein
MSAEDPVTQSGRHGLGDPRIPWVVLLDLDLDEQPGPDTVADRLAAVAVSARWPAPSPEAVLTGARRDLLGRLAAGAPEVLRVGLHDRGLVLAVRHDALDGLGMLTVAGRLLEADLRSSARGVDPARGGAGGAGALLERLWEVGARPPARVAGSSGTPGAGDAFARVTVDAAPRTADLVHAGAGAVVAWNRRLGVPARRVTVAVGVSTVGGASYDLADHSGFLRLRGVETMTVDDVRRELAHAPLQPGGQAPSHPLVARASGLALRVAARRLGSTLLVSHLGSVGAPASVGGAAFHPVTGGGSGLSLGAATLHGRTTITLRARGSQHDDEGLQSLLALVVEKLGSS